MFENQTIAKSTIFQDEAYFKTANDISFELGITFAKNNTYALIDPRYGNVKAY